MTRAQALQQFNTVPYIGGHIAVVGDASNPNGDPSNGQPRMNSNGHGLIHANSVKRKLKDIIAKKGPLFRAVAAKLGIPESDFDQFDIYCDKDKTVKDLLTEWNTDPQKFVNRYIDARLFGTTLLEKGADGANCRIKRGVLFFSNLVSIAPIQITNHPGTRVGGVTADSDQGNIPVRYSVDHAVYFGTFHTKPMSATETGCTDRDIKLALMLLPYIYLEEGGCAAAGTYVKDVCYYESQKSIPVPTERIAEGYRPRRKDITDLPRNIADYNWPTAGDLPKHITVTNPVAVFEE